MADRIAELVAALTLDEKISLLAGQDVWTTVPIERLGIPSIKVTDGPVGVRGADQNHSPRSISVPVGVAMGATFDPELIEQVGRALGHATRLKGASVLLGPTMNIPRVPNAGRNFECFSEDPFLSGTIAAGYVTGLQSEGVAACVKHVVCNDQETDRFSIDAVVAERPLREVYLEPFRIAIEKARPWSAMSAYNTINGTTASEHPLLEEILRADYGFDGVVISDWFGTYSAAAVTAGLDLEMPGPARWMAAEHVRAALDAGTVTEADLDRKVANLLTLIERTGGFDRPEPGPERGEDRAEDRALARAVASDSMVLLRNAGTLPLQSPSRIAVIGDLARRTPIVGGGSAGSHHPHRAVSVLEGLLEAVGDAAEVTWALGCEAWARPPLLDAETLSHDGEPGLRAEYFEGLRPEGTPLRTESLAKSFAGWYGPGAGDLDHGNFSLRLSGTYTPTASGPHRFTFHTIGRARMRFGSDWVVDAWDETTGLHTWEGELEAGTPVDLLVEYASVPDERWRAVQFGVEAPTPEDPIAEAAAAAADADVAVVVVGLSDEWETEGADRPDLRLPRDQDRLVAAVAAAQPNTVVVLTSGSPLELPWLDDVAAVLQAWYGGQEVGHAVADVLLGHADPGGRLPITWPTDSRQHPGLLSFPGESGEVRYGEGVHVGYRAYDRLGIEPLFRFGHGGSYTTFELVDQAAEVAGSGVRVTCTLANTGQRDGTEVVQVYARGVGGVERRLVGYAKHRLGAGDRTPVDIEISRDHLAWWDPSAGGWAHPTGRLELELVGTYGTRVATVELGEALSATHATSMKD